MAIEMKIPKKINKIAAKFVGRPFTLRKSVCSAIFLLVGTVLFIFAKPYIGLALAELLVVLSATVGFFCGWYNPKS